MSKPGKILIADDDALFRQTIAAVLEQAGYVCSCVEDAARVLEVMAREPFDLLIAEVRMPGNGQLELIQSLQRSSVSVPVILVSGAPSLDTALSAIQLQILAYLVKPFAIDCLLTEVQRAIARADMQRRMLELQNRWRLWAEELLDGAALIEPGVVSDTLTIETMLTVSLQNLSRCIAEVQELRQVIGTSAQLISPAAAPALARRSAADAFIPAMENLTAEVSGNGENEVMSLPAALRAELRQLSRREREVLRLLLTNNRPQTIANKLFISLHTVRNHLRSIFEKLAVHSQTELLTRLGRYATYTDLQEVV